MKKTLKQKLKKAVVGTLAGASLFASGCGELGQAIIADSPLGALGLNPYDVAEIAGKELAINGKGKNVTAEDRERLYRAAELAGKLGDRKHETDLYNQSRNSNNQINPRAYNDNYLISKEYLNTKLRRYIYYKQMQKKGKGRPGLYFPAIKSEGFYDCPEGFNYFSTMGVDFCESQQLR